METTSKQILLAKINDVINRKVRPFLQQDGGDIEVVDFRDDGMVLVKLQGACHGCPSAMQTLSFGVERALKNEIEEVRGVRQVEDVCIG